MHSAKKICKFTRSEIFALKRGARTILRSSGIHLLGMPTSEEAPGKMLLVVPRATGTAPQRNRIRRQLKAIFYEEQLAARPINYVVVVDKRALSLSFLSLKKLLTTNKTPRKSS